MFTHEKKLWSRLRDVEEIEMLKSWRYLWDLFFGCLSYQMSPPAFTSKSIFASCIWSLTLCRSSCFHDIFVTCLVMPPNCKKRCSLCGKKSHNVRSCNIKMAAKFRSLLALQSHNAKAGTSRVLRGTVEAAKKGRLLPSLSPKLARSKQTAYRKMSRKLYSGDAAPIRKHRLWQGPSLPRSHCSVVGNWGFRHSCWVSQMSTWWIAGPLQTS